MSLYVSASERGLQPLLLLRLLHALQRTQL